MKLKYLTLVFITPFFSGYSFQQLKKINKKWQISIISLGTILVLFSSLIYFLYLIAIIKGINNLSFYLLGLTFGFTLKIIIIAILAEIFISAVLKKSLKIEILFSIMSISSLPLIFGLFFQFVFPQQGYTFQFIGLFIFGILISIGIGIFYKIKFLKTVLIIFGILLFLGYIESILFGIRISS